MYINCAKRTRNADFHIIVGDDDDDDDDDDDEKVC